MALVSPMTTNAKKKKPVYVGLSISRQLIELTTFSVKNSAIETVVSLPTPVGLFDSDGDQILEPVLLKEILSQLTRSMKPRPTHVHLSLPGTLLRMVELPRMEAKSLYVSLSSEAERYKSFDGTEAVVDFVSLENPHLAANQQQIIFGAIRSDSLAIYSKVLKDLRIKTASINLEPLNVLRAMAGTGILDGLIQQIGTEAYWGSIFVEPTRVRLFVWQCNRLVALRETAMETTDFSQVDGDSLVIEDILEEIRRTTKSIQPSLWLSHNLPPAMGRMLSQRLESPVVVASLGTSLALPAQPVSPAAAGAALTSVVAFPFEFDINEGISPSGVSTPGNSASSELGGNEGPPTLIIAGVACLVLSVLACGILFLLSVAVEQQIQPLTNQRDSVRMQVASLEGRQAELRRKLELDQSLLQAIHNARLRNRVYVALTDDLKRKTPQQLWIQTMKVGTALEMDGKSMNQNAVLDFARSFDSAPYTQAVLIDSIKEEKLKNTLVYDFKISGGVRLVPELIPEEKTPSENGEVPPEPGA